VHPNQNKNAKPEDEDLIPAIELVLRTKWGKPLEVDWNGTEIIL
jgi:hypothetical protein